MVTLYPRHVRVNDKQSVLITTQHLFKTIEAQKNAYLLVTQNTVTLENTI